METLKISKISIVYRELNADDYNSTSHVTSESDYRIYCDLYDTIESGYRNENFSLKSVAFHTEDVIFKNKFSGFCLRLSPSDRVVFCKWITDNIMGGMDNHSYWLSHTIREEEARKNDPEYY